MLCSFALAQLQPPVPSTGVNTQAAQRQPGAPQQAAAQDNRGTENNPVFVEVVPSDTRKAETEEAEKHRQEEAADEHALTVWTRILAVVTGLLFVAAGFQVGLFWWQLRLMRRGMDDASSAASAALVAAHRPWIRISDVKLTNVSLSGRELVVNYSLNLRNTGGSPALHLMHIALAQRGPFDPANIENTINTIDYGDDIAKSHLTSVAVYPSELPTEIFFVAKGVMPESFDDSEPFHLLCGVSYRLAFGDRNDRYVVEDFVCCQGEIVEPDQTFAN